MRLLRRALALLLLVVMMPHAAGAEEAAPEPGSALWKNLGERFRFSGWLEALQSVRMRRPHNAVTSRARLRLEAEADLEAVYVFASADAEKNWKVDSETGVDLHEMWLEHVGDGWDLRVGRQIVIWGKADGVQVTDVICPPDYTESITRDLDEIRQPVDAAKLRLLGDAANLELILIPVFQEAILPTDDNPWRVRRAVPDNVRVRRDKTRKPKTSPENVEIAARLSGYYSGLDVAASAFYTWDDLPAYHRSLSYADGAVDIGYRPRHHRLTVYGLEFSRPWSDFVFRGEAAWYVGRYRESTATDPVQRDSLKWLLGLDWTPGDDWSIYAQFINESIFGNTAALTADPSDSLITLHVSKKLFNQTLTLSDMVYVDLNDGDFYNRIKAEYELRDGLFASVGLDVFCGGRDGQFGVYKDNSQAWCKIKYSF